MARGQSVPALLVIFGVSVALVSCGPPEHETRTVEEPLFRGTESFEVHYLTFADRPDRPPVRPMYTVVVDRVLYTCETRDRCEEVLDQALELRERNRQFRAQQQAVATYSTRPRLPPEPPSEPGGHGH